MYKLTLTRSERKAINFAGYRYCCGDELFNHLCDSEFDHDWDSQEDIEFRIPENLAWLINECISEDTNKLETCFPLFSDELSKKLIDFYNEVI